MGRGFWHDFVHAIADVDFDLGSWILVVLEDGAATVSRGGVCQRLTVGSRL